jgi:HNH endonuclease
MSFNEPSVNWIYDRTDGRCHICGKKLSFFNYGRVRLRGAWEVEHSIARALGGTDRLQNLFPGCVPCNRAKGTLSTRSVRARHGRKRAPPSRTGKQRIRETNASVGVLLGASVGSFWGPVGLLGGGALGFQLGYDLDPERQKLGWSDVLVIGGIVWLMHLAVAGRRYGAPPRMRVVPHNFLRTNSTSLPTTGSRTPR